MAGPSLGHVSGSVVEEDTVFADGENVAAKPVRLSFAYFVEEIRVGHGRSGIEAFGRCNVLQVAIEELVQEPFGDPGEGCLHAKDVHCQQRLDEDIARNDPFIRPRQHVDFRGSSLDGILEGFDGAGTTANYQHSLTLDLLAVEIGRMVNTTLEPALVGQRGHLGIAADAYCSNNAIEPAVSLFVVVDDPCACIGPSHGDHGGVE